MTDELLLPALIEWLRRAAMGEILGPLGRMTVLAFLMGFMGIM